MEGATYTDLERGVQFLAGRCDGAINRDGVGYQACDSHFGKRLAYIPLGEWQPSELNRAWRMLVKYGGQLSLIGIDPKAIPEPPKASKSDRIIMATATDFTICFPYDPALVAAVKSEIPRRRFDPIGKRWLAPAIRENAEPLAVFAAQHGFDMTIEAEDRLRELMNTPEPAPAPPARLAAALIQPPPPPRSARTIQLNHAGFIIRFPYDANLVETVKALPGRRFDPNGKFWRLPDSQASLPGLRMLQAQHGFMALDETTAVHIQTLADLMDTNRAESRAMVSDRVEVEGMGGTLRDYQKVAVGWTQRNQRVLLGDEMGCLSGDSILQINRSGCGRKVRLADAYRRFHGCDRHAKHNWDPAITTYAKALCGDELRQHPVVDILDKGERAVVRLTLASGKSLVLTPDHEVAQPGGGWQAAGDLRPGDQVLTNGETVCWRCGESDDIITYRYARFRGYCRCCMYRYLRAKPTLDDGRFPVKDGYIMVSGQFDHPHSSGGPSQVFEHVLVAEQKLGHYLRPGEIPHHIDGNRANNALTNIEILTRSEHSREHRWFRNMDGGTSGRGGEIRFIPRVDTVVSVEPAGTEHVYDVVMADPHRTFVANGIVVHNCGKTVEALASAQATGAFPLLVICPASVTYNWCREAARWLPGKKIAMVAGRTKPVFLPWNTTTNQAARPAALNGGLPAGVDVIIANYDILANGWEQIPAKTPGAKERKQIRLSKVGVALAAYDFRMLVADESHFLKEARSQRTAAVKRLAAGREYQILMTGTPLLNRPKELVAQLEILDRIADFGGSWTFLNRYCDGHRTRFGFDFNGASHLDELNDRLRTSCLLRRTKKDVLAELPPKQRSILPMEIDNRAEYAAAEHDVIEWVRQHALADVEFRASLADLTHAEQIEAIRDHADRKADQAERAEHLVKIEALKQLAVAGKIEAVKDWLRSFTETGEKLVVFAHHIVVVEGLAREFGAPAITGGTSKADRDAAIQRFQNDPACTMIFCNIQAGGIGITLTAASNAAYLELPWTPGALDQSEDRIHRIGQEANACNYWFLLGQDTIEMAIFDLIQQKREVVCAATDGADGEKQTFLILAALDDWLAAKAGDLAGQEQAWIPEPDDQLAGPQDDDDTLDDAED